MVNTSLAKVSPQKVIHHRGASVDASRHIGQKTPGWEFTDLSGLDLDSYAPATDGDPEARSRADGVLKAMIVL